MFQTPILLITFNRPDHTQRVITEIMRQSPSNLYVFQDGPRADNEADVEKCLEVRKIIYHHTNGAQTELHTYFSDINLGCGPGPAAGITWFFNNVDRGIIFEDDCLPSQSIFPFYEQLLNQFNDDERISLITGTNALSKWKSWKQDYIITKTGGMTMGCWASWHRAWELFDFNVKSWKDPEVKGRFRTNVGDKIYKAYQPVLDDISMHSSTDIWDFQWAYARLLNNTYSIVSSVNLVSNIGFGIESTHTPNSNDRRANMHLFSIDHPIRKEDFRNDKLFSWIMYQRFSRKTAKSFATKVCIHLIEIICRK